MKNNKSFGILIIVLFALTGFNLSYNYITSHTVQYTSLRPYHDVTVNDHAETPIRTSRTFRLKVDSKQKLDSAEQVPNKNNTSKLSPVLYHQNKPFLLWAAMICMMVTIASASFPIFIYKIYRIRQRFTLSWRKMLLGLTYTGLFVLVVIIFNSGGQLTGYLSPEMVIREFDILFVNPQILRHIVIATAILILPAMTIVLLTALAADEIPRLIYSSTVLRKNIRLICMLGRILNMAVQFLAVVIVFSVLTSNLLGNAVREIIEIEHFDIYPKEIGVIYGSIFSLFLAIVYLPVHYHLKTHFDHLKEIGELLKTSEGAENVEYLYPPTAFSSSVKENVKLLITVLSPLVSSLLFTT